jgi:hypothetical protein
LLFLLLVLHILAHFVLSFVLHILAHFVLSFVLHFSHLHPAAFVEVVAAVSSFCFFIFSLFFVWNPGMVSLSLLPYPFQLAHNTPRHFPFFNFGKTSLDAET